MELRLIFQEVLERIPDMHTVAAPEILRSNFIGGIKHMKVEFTPGPRRRTRRLTGQNVSGTNVCSAIGGRT